MIDPADLPPHVRPDQVPNFEALIAGLGAPPELAHAEIAHWPLRATMVGVFSDGEVGPVPDVEFKDRHFRRWLGCKGRSGELEEALRVAREDGASPLQPLIERTERYLGACVALSTVAQDESLYDMSAIEPTTLANGNKVGVSGRRLVQLDQPVRSVLHYGPSFQGRYYIDVQIDNVDEGGEPFLYMPVTRKPFIAEFLKRYMQYRLLGPDANFEEFEREVQPLAFRPREDGIATASADLIAQREQQGQPVDTIDVVACSGLYTASEHDMRIGLQNAHRLLRTGGALLLANRVSRAAPSHLDAGQIFEMAAAAGFTVNPAQISTTKRANYKAKYEWQSAILIKE